MHGLRTHTGWRNPVGGGTRARRWLLLRLLLRLTLLLLFITLLLSHLLAK